LIHPNKKRYNALKEMQFHNERAYGQHRRRILLCSCVFDAKRREKWVTAAIAPDRLKVRRAALRGAQPTQRAICSRQNKWRRSIACAARRLIGALRPPGGDGSANSAVFNHQIPRRPTEAIPKVGALRSVARKDHPPQRFAVSERKTPNLHNDRRNLNSPQRRAAVERPPTD
jgi:hypothetical protein